MLDLRCINYNIMCRLKPKVTGFTKTRAQGKAESGPDSSKALGLNNECKNLHLFLFSFVICNGYQHGVMGKKLAIQKMKCQHKYALRLSNPLKRKKIGLLCGLQLHH